MQKLVLRLVLAVAVMRKALPTLHQEGNQVTLVAAAVWEEGIQRPKLSTLQMRWLLSGKCVKDKTTPFVFSLSNTTAGNVRLFSVRTSIELLALYCQLLVELSFSTTTLPIVLC